MGELLRSGPRPVHPQRPPVVASESQQAAVSVAAQQLDRWVGAQQVAGEVSGVRVGAGAAGLSGVRAIGVESSD